MKPKLLPLLFPLAAAPVLAGLPGPELVKDIRPGSSGSMIVGDTSFGTTGETLFFGADNGSQGKELWKSDGTPDGTVMLKDLCSGAHGGSPRSFMTVGNSTFFTGHDLTHGTELWRSDGTATGTLMLKDIVTGTDRSSYPQFIGAADNTLYFTADAERQLDGNLWKSDGTPGGTVKVTTIHPGGRARFYSGVALGGTFYFHASRDTSTELWRTDGTAAGTRLVTKVDSAPVVAGNRLFFCFNDAAHGRELWTSDGTPEGTSMVKDLNADLSNRGPSGMIAAGNLVYFSAQASNDPSSWALWRSDGSAEGTFPVLELAEGFYGNFHRMGDHLYFAPKLRDGTTGIWKSDGTVEGTQLVKPGITGSQVKYFSNGTKDFYFSPSLVGQLWQSDGTPGGTRPVADLFMGSSGSGSEAYPRTVNGKLLLGVYNPATGKELYSYDTRPPAIAPAVMSEHTTTGLRIEVGINPAGLSSTATFEYGPTESYGTSKPVFLAGGELISRFQDFPLELSGLSPGTTYHYRVTASNSAGTRISTGTFQTAFTRPAWRTASFGAGASTLVSGDDQDPDKDGLSNLIEYAFGLDPNRADAGHLPKPGRSGTEMVYEFTRPEGQEDMIYGVEWSPSMAPGSWTPIPDTGGGNLHRFVMPADAGSSAFMRWTVNPR